MESIIVSSISRARKAFSGNISKSLEFRISQLKALLQLLEENKDILINCLKEDLRKPKTETIMGEIDHVKNDIKYQLNNIMEYVKPKAVSISTDSLIGTAYVKYEPYGVTLIIGPWNFPVLLTLQPLVGAITAGNCAIIKPSELAQSTAQTLTELIHKYLDNECYHVINGGPEADF